jgi:hypothetical protein
MSVPASVQIIGTPVACKDGLKDTWREVAEWAAGQLKARFGESVQVQYFDLFDSDCPPLPSHAQLPVIMIDGQLLSSGGKISVPAIRKKLEENRVNSEPT